MNQGGNNPEQGSFERIGEQVGEAAGRAFGRGSDMAAGMFGSLFGTAMDALGDWWSSPAANQAAQDFDQTRDRSCRHHFESTSDMAGGRNYDQVRPLYQFGHMAGQNPDYQGRDFSEVEPDLKRAWDQQSSSPHGEWPDVRSYVDFGFTRRNYTEGPETGSTFQS